jgi:outer membrane protein insertion porin family
MMTKIGRKNPLILDSFTLGLDSFRGFDDGGLGPMAETTRMSTTPVINPITGQVSWPKTTIRDYIGATKYWKGTVEFKFPMGLPEELQFRGFMFTDFGTAWSAPEKGKKFIQSVNTDSALGNIITSTVDTAKSVATDGLVINHKILDRRKVRASIGFGISFLTPFGPMVFTYAIPVRKEKYDEQQRFLVGFSTTF